MAKPQPRRLAVELKREMLLRVLHAAVPPQLRAVPILELSTLLLLLLLGSTLIGC